MRELGAATTAFHLLARPRPWWLLLRSISLSAAVTVACLALGVPTGLILARAALPLRRLLLAAHLCIAFLPPFLPALGWFHFFGEQGWLGSELTSRALFSELGAVWVLTTCFTPIVTGLTALGVSGVDAALEEAGRVSLGPARTALRVLLPCCAPAISLAALIVFALTFTELGVPLFLSVDVYQTVVFARLAGIDFAPGEAAVLMLPLLLVALLLAALERRFAGGRALAALGAFRAARAPLLPFSSSLLAVAALAAGVSLCPLAALLLSADLSAGPAELLRWAGDTPWTSLKSAAAAAALLTAMALVLGGELLRRTRAGVSSDALAMLTFLMPSAILGVGLMAAWNHPSSAWLYGSTGILVVGFVARYGAVALRTYSTVLAQLPVSLDEAARASGASYSQRLALTLGMTLRGVAGTFLLVLTFALRDLESAVLYYPPGEQPLTVRIFTLEANGPAGVVSALALLQVLLTLATLACGGLLLRSSKA